MSEVTWTCHVCRRPIERASGHVAIDPDGPRRHWRAYHFTCDPQPESDDYSIPVERISTLRGVLGWTAHLMGKRWIAETDWADVLRELAGRRETP